MIPNKAFYMAVHDLRHLSKYFGVPLGNLEVYIHIHAICLIYAIHIYMCHLQLCPFFNAIFLQSSLLFFAKLLSSLYIIGYC